MDHFALTAESVDGRGQSVHQNRPLIRKRGRGGRCAHTEARYLLHKLKPLTFLRWRWGVLKGCPLGVDQRKCAKAQKVEPSKTCCSLSLLCVMSATTPSCGTIVALDSSDP